MTNKEKIKGANFTTKHLPAENLFSIRSLGSVHGTGNLSKRNNNSISAIKLSLGSGQGTAGLSEERVDTDYCISY